ncbi:hypothetical protein FRB93_008695 [Tulasnella sp. JGI-2019a]|nr:hypothetical protein FRB93_008695 [Tulasnella sp. JGI-2019a]
MSYRFPSHLKVLLANDMSFSQHPPGHLENHLRRHHINRAKIDPFLHPESADYSLFHAILATALFRCCHLIIFFTGWATMVVLITVHVHDLTFPSTLLTVFSTVLGFVISYRTTASFERYNEGRRYWSSIVYGSRLLARTIWFHVPDEPATSEKLSATELSQLRARTIIEKKSAINLIEAFAMALKHYLRGEESIYFLDLYHLVKHLPVYALPAGRPINAHENTDQQPPIDEQAYRENLERIETRRSAKVTFQPRRRESTSTGHSELSNTSRTPSVQSDVQSRSRRRAPSASAAAFSMPPAIQEEKVSSESDLERGGPSTLPTQSQTTGEDAAERVGQVLSATSAESKQPILRPGWNPPPYTIFDIFPFSLLIDQMAARGHFEGKRAIRLKARKGIVNHNIPLEISFYLSSYIAALQFRKVCDVPTTNTLLAGLNQLADSLTGLERILTTPVPFSYSAHLWTVTTIYVALLAFVFYGFIVAGEEIENPFSYDKNDLDLDHFTDNIIRPELHALTSRPMPDVGVWAFNAQNAHVFHGHGRGEKDVTPDEWLARGNDAIREVLTKADPCQGSHSQQF